MELTSSTSRRRWQFVHDLSGFAGNGLRAGIVRRPTPSKPIRVSCMRRERELRMSTTTELDITTPTISINRETSMARFAATRRVSER
jgi:hypothetical protein